MKKLVCALALLGLTTGCVPVTLSLTGVKLGGREVIYHQTSYDGANSAEGVIDAPSDVDSRAEVPLNPAL